MGQAGLIGLALFLVTPLAALAPLGLAPLVVAAGGLSALLALVRERRCGVPRHPAALLLLALTGWGALSLLWTINGERTLNAALGLLAVFAAGLCLLHAASRLAAAERRRVERALLAGLLLGFALMIGQKLLGQGLIAWLRAAPWPGYLSPKLIGRPASVLLLLAWPAGLMLYRRYGTIAALVPPLLAGVAAVALWHRASMIAVAVGLAVLGLAWRHAGLVRKALAALLALAVLGAVPAGLGLAALGLDQAASLPSSARHRIEIWGFAAERVLERPLLGHGLDASGSIDNHGRVSRFQPPDATLIPLHPHNLFLQAWVELGIGGAALVAGFFVALLSAIGRLPGAAPRFALAGFASWWVILGLSYGAWQTWWLGGTILAATALVVAGRANDEQAPGQDLRHQPSGGAVGGA